MSDNRIVLLNLLIMRAPCSCLAPGDLSPSSVMLLNCYINALLGILIAIVYNRCVMLSICYTLVHGISGCFHVMVMINMSDTGSMNSSDGRLVKY